MYVYCIFNADVTCSVDYCYELKVLTPQSNKHEFVDC